MNGGYGGGFSPYSGQYGVAPQGTPAPWQPPSETGKNFQYGIPGGGPSPVTWGQKGYPYGIPGGGPSPVTSGAKGLSLIHI